ncbi:MAG TPA: TadE family type IV pilus minor pilin [Pseudonocardia sp.]|nr:TadE family type IV pilus minor pilin [Pseudonocardia sp.]
MGARAPAADSDRGRRRPRAARCTGDRGAVTVEAALALCSLAVFLAVAVAAVAAVVMSIRCVDAARELARLAARGEPERGRAVAAAVAPPGARLTLRSEGDLVVAEVSAELVRPLPVRIDGRAVAALEPGAAPP